MAMADYYQCDICKSKTFYDAECSYTDDKFDKETGKVLMYGVGQMRVLCEECIKTKEVVIINK
jgi:hypothetical protein